MRTPAARVRCAGQIELARPTLNALTEYPLISPHPHEQRRHEAARNGGLGLRHLRSRLSQSNGC